MVNTLEIRPQPNFLYEDLLPENAALLTPDFATPIVLQRQHTFALGCLPLFEDAEKPLLSSLSSSCTTAATSIFEKRIAHGMSVVVSLAFKVGMVFPALSYTLYPEQYANLMLSLAETHSQDFSERSVKEFTDAMPITARVITATAPRELRGNPRELIMGGAALWQLATSYENTRAA